MKAKIGFPLLFALCVFVVSSLSAAPPPLAPGASQILNGETALTFPESRGEVIRDKLIPFEILSPVDDSVLIAGTLQDRVVRNADDNLVFAPRIRNLENPSGSVWISGVRLSGYRNVTLAAEYATDGLGNVGPESAQRSAGDGDSLYFSHESQLILPPDEQRFIMAVTDETEFSLVGTVEIFASNDFGGVPISVTLKGTAAPVPIFQVSPGESIQAAIDAAVPGQIVSVSAGTYLENLTMRDEVSVRGEDPCTTIIQGTGTVVIFADVDEVTFSGFGVTGGTKGVSVAGGSPVIENNKIYGNGTGFDIDSGSTALLCGNRVYDNSGTGLLIAKASPVVTNNRIFRNTLGMVLEGAAASGTHVINNTVALNSSDGIQAVDCAPTFKNNLIVSNASAGIRVTPSVGTIDASFQNVYLNAVNHAGFSPSGPGNMSLDPMFDPTESDDFLLLGSSPCIDAGDPAEFYNDLDGTRNDIGATGGPCSESGAPSGSGQPTGFIFTSVGRIPTSAIEDGLANSRGFQDAPFGGTVWLYGGFSADRDEVELYSVHVAEWDGGIHPEEGDFEMLTDPLRKVRWTRAGGGYSPSTVSVGPDEIGGISYYERTRNGGGNIWSHENAMMKWNTGGREGKYDIEIRAYDAARNRLPLNDHRLTLEIDNSEPLAELTSLGYDSEVGIPECAIVRLADENQTLEFGFAVSHANGYLHSYKLEALVGRDRTAGILTGDQYTGSHDSPGPLWTGPGNIKVNEVPMGGWETCAYQFKLTAHRRTTNGFTRLSGVTSFANYALDLDSGVCSPDLDGDGDVDAADLAIFAAAFGK